MRDVNFWIGTAVGSLSALVGAAIMAWVQYRLRIREHRYKRREEDLDRQKQQDDSDRAEREATIALLSDIYGNARNRDRLNRTLNWHGEERRVSGFGEKSMLPMFSGGYFSPDDLRKMDLTELRILHAIAVNIVSLWPMEDVERERMIALLNDIHSNPKSRDRLKRTLETFIEQNPSSEFAEAALHWSVNNYSGESDLRGMDLSKLRLVHAMVVNIISLAPISEIFDRKDEFNEQMEQLAKMLESLRSALPQSAAESSGTDQELTVDGKALS
ncbi:MAG: hypothetical protein AABM67_15480 [Acidobacteriota bacterium]